MNNENMNETEEILNQKEEISFINKSEEFINSNPNDSLKNEEGLISDSSNAIRNNYHEESMNRIEVLNKSHNQNNINKGFEDDNRNINVNNENENSNSKYPVHTSIQQSKNSISNDTELNKFESIEKKSNNLVTSKSCNNKKNISTDPSKGDLNEFKENRRLKKLDDKEENNVDCIGTYEVEKDEINKETDKSECFENDCILEDLVKKEKRDSNKNKKYNNVINTLPLPKINENLNDDSIYFNIKSNDEVDHTFTYNLTENINVKDENLLTENNMDFKEIKYIIDNINPQSIKKADKLEKIQEHKEFIRTEQSNQVKETIVTSQENEISFHKEESDSLSLLNSSFSKDNRKKKKDEINVFSKKIQLFKGFFFSKEFFFLLSGFIFCGYQCYRFKYKSNTN